MRRTQGCRLEPEADLSGDTSYAASAARRLGGASVSSGAWARVERLSQGHLTRAGLGLAATRLLPLTLILVLAYSTLQIERSNIAAGVLGFDFRGTLWNAAHAIRDGASPYPAPRESALGSGNPALYPPLAPLAIVPLTLMPWAGGLAVWTVVLALCVVLALRIVGVRDWRCYAAGLLCPLVADGVVFGNLVVVLVLGTAAAWRWRDRPPVAGAAVGLTIAAKVVGWPLLVWLVLTRRWRAAAWAGAAAAIGILGPWTAIGFKGLLDYPSLLRAADRVYGPHGFSLAASAAALGAGKFAALACLVAAAVALGGCAAGRRDFDRFSLAVLAVVVGSPIAWPYSFSLLLVPIAAASRRFSYLWALFPSVFLLASLTPHGTTAEDVCCRPSGTPQAVWDFLHVPPSAWRPVAFAGAAAVTILAASRVARRRQHELA